MDSLFFIVVFFPWLHCVEFNHLEVIYFFIDHATRDLEVKHNYLWVVCLFVWLFVGFGCCFTVFVSLFIGDELEYQRDSR